MKPHDIDKQVVRKIRQKYSLDDEQKLSRITHAAFNLGTYTLSESEQAELASYQSHVEACKAWGIQEKARIAEENRVNQYNQAVTRLKKYILEDGRPEQIVEPVYADGYDELPIEDRPILKEGYTIPGIEPVEPLMMTRTLYDDEGNETGTEEYLNPVIERDRLEREQAQGIVDTYENA